MVTFRRPASLRAVLASVSSQTVPPVRLVVADNDPDGSARAVVEGLSPRAVPRVTYLPLAHNTGPAGGWAAAAHLAQQQSDRGEWLLVVDDDDPLGHAELVERLLRLAPSVPDAERCGAVGLRGARVDRLYARLRRVAVREGQPAPADYLASGGAPLYRWAALDDVGFFDPDLFFGFEDLDQGLRMAKAGWKLWAVGLPSLHEVADTSPDRAPWREYYKTRALVVIARRHIGLWFLGITLVRSVVLGSLRLAVSGAGARPAGARALGALDGIRQRLGAYRYSPGTNAPKNTARGLARASEASR